MSELTTETTQPSPERLLCRAASLESWADLLRHGSFCIHGVRVSGSIEMQNGRIAETVDLLRQAARVVSSATGPHHSEPARDAVARAIQLNAITALPDEVWGLLNKLPPEELRVIFARLADGTLSASPAPATRDGGLVRMVAHHRQLLADPDNYRVLDRAVHQHLVDTIAALASPAPAAGGLEAVREAMRGAEAAFEAIRIILVNELDEPVRQAFWTAVDARDSLRTALASPAATSAACQTCNGHGMIGGCSGGVASIDGGGGYVDEPCPDCTPAATSAETQGGDGSEVRGSELVRAASALLNNLWQDVWSHKRTHEENWKEFDRKYPGVKWLRDARNAALAPSTSAATRGATLIDEHLTPGFVDDGNCCAGKLAPPMTVPHHSEPARDDIENIVTWLRSGGSNAVVRAMNNTAASIIERLSASPAPAAGGLEAVAVARSVEARLKAKHKAAANARPPDPDAYLLLHQAAGAREVVEALAALASPAATSAETQGGDGVREAHQLDALSCEHDDDCYTLTWSDGRWLTAHTNGTLVAGKSPRQDDIPAVKTSIAALAPSTSAATRGEPVAWRVDIPNFGPALFHDEAEAKAQLAEPGCEQSTIRALVYASPPSAPAGVKVKPLDLSNILKHAFLSGVVAAREIAGHDECDGPALWAKYEPYEPGSYDRIRSSLQPDTQALEDAIALIEKLMASHDYVGTGDSHWAAIERREDEAALSRIRSALQPRPSRNRPSLTSWRSSTSSRSRRWTTACI